MKAFLICLAGFAAIVAGLLLAVFLVLGFLELCLMLLGRIREEWRELTGGAE